MQNKMLNLIKSSKKDIILIVTMFMGHLGLQSFSMFNYICTVVTYTLCEKFVPT